MSTADFIETFTGKRFRPLFPSADSVDIRDIAHHLSNQCRFSGAVRKHYSVAEHSVRVSELLEDTKACLEVQLWGLLHDASEAYLVDIPSPLKITPMFRGYRLAERDLMQVICETFGLAIKQPASVGMADQILLATEVRDLMPNRPEHWGGEKLAFNPLPEMIEPWGPSTAEALFLARFEHLCNLRGAQ